MPIRKKEPKVLVIIYNYDVRMWILNVNANWSDSTYTPVNVDAPLTHYMTVHLDSIGRALKFEPRYPRMLRSRYRGVVGDRPRFTKVAPSSKTSASSPRDHRSGKCFGPSSGGSQPSTAPKISSRTYPWTAVGSYQIIDHKSLSSSRRRRLVRPIEDRHLKRMRLIHSTVVLSLLTSIIYSWIRSPTRVKVSRSRSSFSP